MSQLDLGRSDLVRLAFARLHPMVYSTALRVTGRRADAEDIVQEVFVVLIEQVEQPPAASLPGWLKRTTQLIAWNHVRKRSRRAARVMDIEDWPSAASGDSAAMLEARSLLARLPEELGVALLSKYLMGLTLDEMAQMLGVSVAAAGRRVQKALARVERIDR